MRFVLAILAFAAFPLSAFAQSDQDIVPHDHPPDDCYTTLKSGSGPTYTKVCISSTGNITSYESPAGVEHIRNFWVIEGYRVAHGIPFTSSSWDSGVSDMGLGDDENGVSSIYQPNGRNTLPLRITRTIPRLTGPDFIQRGPLRLVQEFFWRTWNYGPAELYISMKIYNDGRTTFPGKCEGSDDPRCSSGFIIERFFDGDIDGSYVNHAYATRSSAIMFNPSGNGLSLTAGILDKPHVAGVGGFHTVQQHVESGEPQSGQDGADDGAGRSPGDNIGVVTYYLGDILPKRVKSVAFIYRRF